MTLSAFIAAHRRVALGFLFVALVMGALLAVYLHDAIERNRAEREDAAALEFWGYRPLPTP